MCQRRLQNDFYFDYWGTFGYSISTVLVINFSCEKMSGQLLFQLKIFCILLEIKKKYII